jgi:hypothetical protein
MRGGDINHLADRVDSALLARECWEHGVGAPKSMDNAIINNVKLVKVELRVIF